MQNKHFHSTFRNSPQELMVPMSKDGQTKVFPLYSNYRWRTAFKVVNPCVMHL